MQWEVHTIFNYNLLFEAGIGGESDFFHQFIMYYSVVFICDWSLHVTCMTKIAMAENKVAGQLNRRWQYDNSGLGTL